MSREAPLDVHLVRGIDACRSFEREWIDLWEASPRASAYDHPDWLRCQKERGREAIVVVAHREKELVGILSFIERPYRWPLRLGPLHLPSLHVSYASLSGAALLRTMGEGEDATARALLAVLLRDARREVLYFENLATSSPLEKALRESVAAEHRHDVHATSTSTPHWTIELPASLEVYGSEVLGGKLRRELKRKRKSLEEACTHGLRLETFTRLEDVPSFVEKLQWVVERSWQSASLDRGIDEGSRALIAAMARLGWLRGYVLSNGEVPIAAEVDIVIGTRMFAELAGYDRTWAPFQPGKDLQMRIIEDAHALGIRSIDLGTGDHAYKRAFARDHYEEHNVYVVERSPRLKLLRQADWLLSTATKGVKRLADEARVLPFLRQKLRRTKR